jgi:exosortase
METTISLPQTKRTLGKTDLLLVLKAATLALAVVVFYFQDLSIVFANALNDEEMSYILLVPILFAYLIYRKRKMLRATSEATAQNQPKHTAHLGTLSGILMCIVAILLYWYASSTFTPLEYHILTLPIFAAGFTLILFNPTTLRQALFPIAFLALLTPPPVEILNSLGASLTVISAQASNNIVNFVGIHTQTTNDLGSPGITLFRPDGNVAHFTVALACSGIYSLIGFLVFGMFLAFIVRDKLWKKLSIFAIGFPLVYSLNVVRITSMLLMGYQWGEDAGLNAFHLVGGVILIFIGTLVILAISEKIFKTQIFTPKTQAICPDCNANQSNDQTVCPTCGKPIKHARTPIKRSDLAKIPIIIVIVALMFSLQAPVYALTRGPAPLLIQTSTGTQGNTQILPQMPGYNLQFDIRDTYFENISGQDYTLIYSYTPQNKTKQTITVMLEVGGATALLHNWEVCLISWRATHGKQVGVTQLDLKDTSILQNPLITARYFAFQYLDTNATQAVLYWYTQALFTINNQTQTKYVKLSVVTYPQNPQAVPSAEQEMYPFAIAIANQWEPIKTWNTISVIIIQDSLNLSAITLTFLAAVTVYYIIQNKKQQKENVTILEKLSKPNQQLIKTIAKRETLNQITISYKKTQAKTLQKNKSNKESQTCKNWA